VIHLGPARGVIDHDLPQNGSSYLTASSPARKGRSQT
jgi:hypothetical protein